MLHLLVLHIRKKYQKYRLFVSAVNGSDVVSIRKFKIFGLQNDGTPKSGNIFDNLGHEISNSDLTFDLSIAPNPNSGIFTVNLINVEESAEPLMIDSLNIVGGLRKGLSFKEITSPTLAIIQIFDPMGKLVYSTKTNEKCFEVKIENIKNGIYVLKAILPNKEVITRKLVIE